MSGAVPGVSTLLTALSSSCLSAGCSAERCQLLLLLRRAEEGGEKRAAGGSRPSFCSMSTTLKPLRSSLARWLSLRSMGTPDMGMPSEGEEAEEEEEEEALWRAVRWMPQV